MVATIPPLRDPARHNWREAKSRAAPVGMTENDEEKPKNHPGQISATSGRRSGSQDKRNPRAQARVSVPPKSMKKRKPRPTRTDISDQRSGGKKKADPDHHSIPGGSNRLGEERPASEGRALHEQTQEHRQECLCHQSP
jgi:hypothetical protein